MKKSLIAISFLSLLLIAFVVPVTAQDDAPTFTPDGDPTFGMFRLTRGFFPDPWVFSVFAGGPIDASAQDIGEDCRGNIGAVPDVNMEWTEDAEFNLRIFFISEGDTTLIIRDPEGTYYCNDDNGLSGDNVSYLDPSVTIENAIAGTYNIWIGTYLTDNFLPGYLMLTEIENTYPGNIVSSLFSAMTFTLPE